MSRGQLRSCCVFPCFVGISTVLRSWNPNSPFALLRPPQMARLHFKNHIGSVIAQAFFSHGASAISLNLVFFQENLA